MRRILKTGYERSLTGLGITSFARWRRRSATLVLAYHNVVPHGEPAGGDVSLHLPQREFARQLDLLVQTHEIVPLDEIGSNGTCKKPRAVITFDDAYAGALDAGLTELKQRGVPATIFVAPGLLNGASFWWDELAQDTGLDPATREHALTELGGKQDAIRAWAERQYLSLTPPHAHQLSCTEDDLVRAVATGLVTIGAHSWSHPNLSRLAPGELHTELVRPLEWLRSRFPQGVSSIAYPYGLVSSDVLAVTRAVGYDRGFLIDGGWLPAAAERELPLVLPRWNVPAGISRRGFEIRTAGVF